MTTPNIAIVVAMDPNGLIGKNNDLPWPKDKEDMGVFRTLTTGNAVIMGKNTWLSIPEKFRPLPKRDNIIVSSTLHEAKGAYLVRAVPDAVTYATSLEKDTFFIGGSAIYAAALGVAKVMHISHMKRNYNGDTFFPEWNQELWETKEEREFHNFVYRKYERNNR